MKAIGLDTCVVLRLLVGEPQYQAQKALEYFEECYFNNINEYKRTGAGFVDRLIRMDLLDHAHEIVTFDKNFAKPPNITIL